MINCYVAHGLKRKQLENQYAWTASYTKAQNITSPMQSVYAAQRSLLYALVNGFETFLNEVKIQADTSKCTK